MNKLRCLKKVLPEVNIYLILHKTGEYNITKEVFKMLSGRLE
jgi:hypothetical protein